MALVMVERASGREFKLWPRWRGNVTTKSGKLAGQRLYAAVLQALGGVDSTQRARSEDK